MRSQDDRGNKTSTFELYTTNLKQLFIRPWFPYVCPFAMFLLLSVPAGFFPEWTPFLYIGKTVIVGALLWFWRHRYAADLSARLSSYEWLTAFTCGLVVLVIWIVPESYLPQYGHPAGFDPYGFGWSKAAVRAMIAVRLIGAAVVVPIMEELFWRSFLMRYLINSNFRSVPMGAFSWYSFLSVAIVFGLEHHRIVVGIIAGVIYNLLLIRRKKLRGTILAHGIPNLGLGIYVLLTHSWMFW